MNVSPGRSYCKDPRCMKSRQHAGAMAILCWLAIGALAHAQNSELKAFATAERAPDGTATVRKSTSQEQASMNDYGAAVASVNAKFPPPPEPHGPFFRAESVSPDGVIVTTKGPAIRFDGIKCSSEGIRYLQ